MGAMFWCVGTDEARWPSEKLPMDGDAEERWYSSVKGMRRSERVRAMFERGDDLYGSMVRRGHELGMDVFVSLRMNDNHFWSDSARKAPPLAPEEMAQTTRPHLTQFRKDHPEWVLGIGNAPRWAVTSWNMAIPEVREHSLIRIREACAQADWDGIEIDWQRHAFHLPEHDAYRLRYTLTDFMRAVRNVTDEFADKRGRPFYLAVRVGASRETNRRIGYDVETWIADGLCDIVATNANSGTDPGVEVDEYVAMMEGTNVRLYPGYDSHGEFGTGHLVSANPWREAWFRGLTKGYYDRGASGVHLFNWQRQANTLRPCWRPLARGGPWRGAARSTSLSSATSATNPRSDMAQREMTDSWVKCRSSSTERSRGSVRPSVSASTTTLSPRLTPARWTAPSSRLTSTTGRHQIVSRSTSMVTNLPPGNRFLPLPGTSPTPAMSPKTHGSSGFCNPSRLPTERTGSKSSCSSATPESASPSSSTTSRSTSTMHEGAPLGHCATPLKR